jgi:hypothetical protein
MRTAGGRRCGLPRRHRSLDNSAGQEDLGKAGTVANPLALCSVVNFPGRNLAGGRAASRECSEAGGPAAAQPGAMPVRRFRGFREAFVLLALERLFRLALMVLDFGRVINLT